MSFHGLIAHFFLGLSNTPLSGYTTVCLSIHLLKKHLAFFQVLVIINKDAVKSTYIYIHTHTHTHTHEFLCGHKFSTSLGKYQGMQLMDHMVRVCLVYKRDHQTTL